jgi:FixJ family two-component response regulator
MMADGALIQAAEPIILVVDDDESVRAALSSLFRSVGFDVRLFASTAALFAAGFPDAPSCLVLDIRLPGKSGLDVQAELARSQIDIPIVMMTGHGDIQMSVRAMKAGAIDFLAKPFRDQDMLDAVALALDRDRERRQARHEMRELQERYATLTARERDVMQLVTQGLMNKQVAGELGLSEITVKIHRAHAMRKMAARTLADLIRMADSLAREAMPGP